MPRLFAACDSGDGTAAQSLRTRDKFCSPDRPRLRNRAATRLLSKSQLHVAPGMLCRELKPVRRAIPPHAGPLESGAAFAPQHQSVSHYLGNPAWILTRGSILEATPVGKTFIRLVRGVEHAVHGETAIRMQLPGKHDVRCHRVGRR